MHERKNPSHHLIRDVNGRHILGPCRWRLSSLTQR
jgi:hypothetical protein